MHLREHFEGCSCLCGLLKSFHVPMLLQSRGWFRLMDSEGRVSQDRMSWHRTEYVYGGSSLRRQSLPSWWIRKESAGLEAEARVSIKDMPMSHLPNSDSSWLSSAETKNLWEYSRLKPSQHLCVHLGFSKQKNKTNKNHLRLRALAFLLVTENIFLVGVSLFIGLWTWLLGILNY